MDFWNNIYSKFDPVAFSIFSLPVHWYGIMYVLALLSALYIAKWYVKHDGLSITDTELDIYFIWAEIGVILGARVGYIIFYDSDPMYYLYAPWQMFNPFRDGEFVGISGLSYHGAIIGFLLATYLYNRKHRVGFGVIMDIVAVAVPLAYIFGRIGNFLNQELIGKVTDVDWGIYVDGVLRHPSQLYEAFLEGLALFLIIWFYRKRKSFDGELILLYGFGYSVARFVAEIWREPDSQLGYLFYSLSMGQILSIIMMALSAAVWVFFKRRATLSR